MRAPGRLGRNRRGLEGPDIARLAAVSRYSRPVAGSGFQPQQFQTMRREHGVAVATSLALLQSDQHARPG